MNYEIKQHDKFRFIEEGEGEPLLLLHGLFGALSNFRDLIEHFRGSHKVVVPMLPLFDLDIFHTSVGGLEKFVQKFVEARGYRKVALCYFGTARPFVYGIRDDDWRWARDIDECDWLAISATALQGLYRGSDTLFSRFDRLPSIRVGYTIFLYDLKDPRVRAALDAERSAGWAR